MDLRFLEASPDCVKLVGLDGVVQFMNANGLCLMEIDNFESVRGKGWSDLWPQDSRPMIENAIREATGGGVSRFTAACPTAKGAPRWWDVAVSPVVKDDGRVEVLIATSRDITQLKSIESTLKLSEQRFRALADTIPQLAWMSTPNGEVFWYNQRWFDYTGTTFDDMRGFGWKSVHHPDHLDRVVDKFLSMLTVGQVWEDVFPIKAANGEYRWFLSRAMPQYSADGRAVLYCGTNTDITEQRNQSQRLRQLARIVEMSHEAIIVWDFEGGITSWNRGCVELYGYSKADAIGRSCHDLLRAELPLPADQFVDNLLVEGFWSGEILHRASDGSDVWVESRQEVIRVGGRRLVLETNRDITERRRADEVRTLLVAELNHRVKNMLAIVQSIATQTARSAKSVAQFSEGFRGRLHALANAHNVLSDSHWVGAWVGDLVRIQQMLYGHRAAQIQFQGADAFLPPQVAVQFSLVLHELFSNALVHGALASETGRVEINWVVADEDPTVLTLKWKERGGPPLKETNERGFGLSLIDVSNRLPSLQTSVKFEPNGLAADIRVKLAPAVGQNLASLFNPGRKSTRALSASESQKAEPRRLRILLVAREPNDAMRLEEVIYDSGHVTLGPVGTIEELQAKLSRLAAEIVIVDLGGKLGNADRMITEIASRNYPMILLGSPDQLSEVNAPISVRKVVKPWGRSALLSAISDVHGEGDLKPDAVQAT